MTSNTRVPKTEITDAVVAPTLLGHLVQQLGQSRVGVGVVLVAAGIVIANPRSFRPSGTPARPRGR
jgi:hypothetical protein